MQREWTMDWWEIEHVHQKRIGEDLIEIYFTVETTAGKKSSHSISNHIKPHILSFVV